MRRYKVRVQFPGGHRTTIASEFTSISNAQTQGLVYTIDREQKTTEEAWNKARSEAYKARPDQDILLPNGLAIWFEAYDRD